MNQLYEKAFAFRNLKLWEKLEDDQVFAVQVGDQTCYINIMGMLGQHYSMAVYPGENALRGLWRMYQMADTTELEEMAAGFGQESLQCEFHPKEELFEDALEAVQNYLKSKGSSMRGKKNELLPQFVRFRPYREQKVISEPAEMEMLGEALDGAIWLANKMGKKIRSLASMSFGYDEKMPLLHRDGDSWRMEEISMPEEPEIEYPVGHTPNDIYKAKTRKLKKKGTWTCELMLMPELSTAEGTDEKVYPWALLTLNIPDRKGIQVQPVRDYETRTEVMLDKIMEAMFRENVCPKEIEVSDDRTYALLSEWCPEMGIRLTMLDYQPDEMGELEESLLMQSQPEKVIEGMEQMLDMLLMLPDEVLFDNPELGSYVAAFREMAKEPAMPESMRSKITTIIARYDRHEGKGKKKGKLVSLGKGKGKKNAIPEKSFVISVSLGTGCYRHIQISNLAMLEDLSDEILDAFEFDNDHAHAFFMDNRAFSWNNAYYMRGMGEGEAETDETTLAESGLQVGQKFKYIFDFGDEWTFQCKVLKELDEITPSPTIVRTKGNPPPQYPDWDEEEDWDDDDEDWDEDDD